MALKHAFIALALLPAAAYADCESAAGKARESILASGPFHYSSRQWNKNFDRLEVGMIEPNKAEHIVETTQNGQRGHETIYIDKQSWDNDGFGWLPPLATMWSHQFRVPDSPYQAVKTKCLGDVEIEAKRLIGYEVEAKNSVQMFTEKIFVDPDTGLSVRYERTGDRPEAINVINTYRYDASIRIEPPEIDLASRKAKSLEAFQRAVDSADAKCRQEVIDKIDHSQTSLPFRYEIAGSFWSGISGIHGTFVPPGSVHNTLDGAPYHGGGSETLIIGNRVWRRGARREWVQANDPSPLAGAASASWSGGLFFPGYLNKVPNHVGGAACLGEIEKDQSRYRLYEYEVYVDTDTARILASERRMFVDAATDLPAFFEDLGYRGQVVRRETRTYDKDITITPPSLAPPPGQDTPVPGRF
ncbi:hypothetical protein UP09_19685 [Bradyrhizobium sp. LTSP885]|uniref:hypothetical protein n=1 Tax=Bradyrhizobium sp. LTSP885 TaxID=1619232 RepID=UPI0005C8E735|nr:hypothetical protein [Bradyrhizobium sp. LTSP885]KJC42436.1 hypothetical protein UP09_19685 [Bradyrhizobium sp. LTSP885]